MKYLCLNSFVKLDSFYDQLIEVWLSESRQGFSTRDIYIQQKAMFIISYMYQKTVGKKNCSYCQQKVLSQIYRFNRKLCLLCRIQNQLYSYSFILSEIYSLIYLFIHLFIYLFNLFILFIRYLTEIYLSKIYQAIFPRISIYYNL